MSDLTGRNVRLFYVLEAILSLTGGIILPVYVVYFRNFDVSLFQVALLAAIFEATIIIFEVPTGIFADRFGRRLSTVAGFFLLTVAGAIFFAFRSFTGFVVAEIVFGISETFISGALEALAVDSLDKDEREKSLPRLFANRTMVKTSALLIGMIAGGYLAGRFLPSLFAPVIFIAAVGLAAALFLRESVREESGAEKAKEKARSVAGTVFRNGAVLALFAVGLFSNFVYEPADQFWQVLFSEIKGVPASYFGIFTAAGLILVIAVARFSERLYERLTLYLSICFALVGVALFVAASTAIYPALAGIVVYFALKELVRPAISTHLNRQFESARRATYLSAFNLTCSIGEVAAGITAGILAGKYGVVFIFYFAAVAALVMLIIYLSLSGLAAAKMKSAA
ncbi:MAG: MFS transporter [Candidatus Zixiibacteriota bacterium]|nr:MAG: MFS transporter [candidate division Zixibacteria bacterium]